MNKILNNKYIKITAALLFWVAVWIIAARIVNEELLFPYPWTTFARLFSLAKTPSFLVTILYSFARVIAGMAIAIVIGISGGLLTGFVKPVSYVTDPMLDVIKATPIASFIILLTLWLSRSIVPLIIAVITMTPIIWTNVQEGVRTADKSLITMCDLYGVSKLKKFRYIYLPSILPFLKSGVISSTGMAWKSAIAAEMIVMPLISIGREMYYASNNLDTSGVFAWTLAVILLSVFVEKLMKTLLRKHMIKDRKHKGSMINK